MGKCSGCGKEFDYEKYYGICPKCGVYNKENLSQEVYEELHRQYDGETPKDESTQKTYAAENRSDAGGNTSWTAGAAGNQQIYVAKPVTERKRAKSSGMSIAVFICILIGIVIGIIFPFGYLMGKSVSLVSDLEWDSTVDILEDYEENGSIDFYEEDNKIPNMPEILSKEAGEAFQIGEAVTYHISVESAEVVAAAGTVPDFPPAENLVAVKVNYERTGDSNGYEYYSYNMFDVAYVGYNGTFKPCVDEYVLMDYEAVLPQMNILDVWEISEDANGTGVFLVFVPVGVTEIDFYLESRSEETNHIQEIYSVPLQINAGEEV